MSKSNQAFFVGLIVGAGILIIGVMLFIFLTNNETTKTTPARPPSPMPTVERVQRPTATPRPAPMPTYVPAGESLRQFIERRKADLTRNMEYDDLIVSCKDKLGNGADDVAFVLLCTGDQDPARTNKTKAITLTITATNDSIIGLIVNAPDIQEYDNTVVECLARNDQEPECDVHEALTFPEVMGLLVGPIQFFEDY